LATVTSSTGPSVFRWKPAADSPTCSAIRWDSRDADAMQSTFSAPTPTTSTCRNPVPLPPSTHRHTGRHLRDTGEQQCRQGHLVRLAAQRRREHDRINWSPSPAPDTALGAALRDPTEQLLGLRLNTPPER